jgi:hypothetical protein
MSESYNLKSDNIIKFRINIISEDYKTGIATDLRLEILWSQQQHHQHPSNQLSSSLYSGLGRGVRVGPQSNSSVLSFLFMQGFGENQGEEADVTCWIGGDWGDGCECETPGEEQA